MRQTGIIAAAGTIALEQMVDRLAEDHMNARRLAEGIAQISGLSIDLAGIHTNIIYFDLVSDRLTADELITRLRKKGIWLLHTGPSRFRVVTHHGIHSEDIDAVLVILGEVIESNTPGSRRDHL
jgi:threonine aldolase